MSSGLTVVSGCSLLVMTPIPLTIVSFYHTSHDVSTLDNVRYTAQFGHLLNANMVHRRRLEACLVSLCHVSVVEN